MVQPRRKTRLTDLRAGPRGAVLLQDSEFLIGQTKPIHVLDLPQRGQDIEV